MPENPISGDPTDPTDPLGDGLAALAGRARSSIPPPAAAVVGRAHRRRHHRHVAVAVAVPVVAAAVAVGAVDLPSHHHTTDVAAGAHRSGSTGAQADQPAAGRQGPGASSSSLGPDPYHPAYPTIPPARVRVGPGPAGAICHVVLDPAVGARRASLPTDPSSVNVLWIPAGLAVSHCRTTTSVAGSSEARTLLRRIGAAPHLPAVDGCPVTAHGSVNLAFATAGTSRVAVVTVTLGPCGRVTLPNGQVRQLGDLRAALDALHPPAWVRPATTAATAG